jgi:peptidoglycan pentaglycine glycine transferase (the first glycine)
VDALEWNSIVAALPQPHLLQTWEWGQVKARFGWQPLPQVWRNNDGEVVAAALVLRRAIQIRGFSARLGLLYIPRGPLMDWQNEALRRRVLADLARLARKQGAIFLKMDPDVPLGTGIPGLPESLECELGKGVVDDLLERGWRFSEDQVQFRNTVMVDLTLDEDQLLSKMKQKTRYNIRLASRKGVSIRSGKEADLGLLYRMYAETSLRDGFVIREENYYRTLWAEFMSGNPGSRGPAAQPLIAEVDGEPVAALIYFRFDRKAWYMYGMSRPAHREKMPNYLLQWEAMCRAKASGCVVYDLWGAPDEFNENDPMWGVYRFKDGLGGQVVRHIGAWDLTIHKLWFRLYNQALPRILNFMRQRGVGLTRKRFQVEN